MLRRRYEFVLHAATINPERAKLIRAKMQEFLSLTNECQLQEASSNVMLDEEGEKMLAADELELGEAETFQ